MRHILIIALVISFSVQIGHSQIFDRIVNNTTDRLTKKLEDKIVNEINNEIERATYKPVEEAIDDMFRREYESTVEEDGNSDQDYSGFLDAMLTPVELPSEYSFDVHIYAETKDYDGDKNDMEILMSSTHGHVGIVTMDGDNKSMVIFDANKDIMAMYSTKKGKKQVSAFPSMMSLAASKSEEIMEDITMEKTGKTKKVAGYQCHEWKIEDETTNTKAYIAEDFPASWLKSFGSMFKNVSPTTRNNLLDGMTLKSETKTKKKGKKSTFETKKVVTETYTVLNSDYEQIQYGKD